MDINNVQACRDDAQLIAQFQGGNQSVFNELVRRYQERIYRLARRYVKNREDALDITQEAFLRAYRALPNFKGGSQFYTWLYRITVNLCIDFQRRNTWRKMMVDGVESDDDLLMNIADPHVPPPSKAVENEELLTHLQKAIFQLSPQQREIFILRHREGLSLKEIAHKSKRSMGTVKAHLFHARQNLQNALRPYLNACSEIPRSDAVRDH
jgi:RNA polymerase sigma-70 factor (ECF subfamily)